MPEILTLTRHNGVAGQVAYTATVQHPEEQLVTVTFVGSRYGGPVVMCTATSETFVTEPARFGEFGAQWVRNFFGGESA